MTTSASFSLTLPQKIRLAVSVFAIYWPIRLFINLDRGSWPLLKYVWPLWLIEIPLTVLFLVAWLGVMEWMQETIFRRTRQDFLIDTQWPAQLATLVLAGTMAVAFNAGFRHLLIQLDTAFSRHRSAQEAPWRRAAPPRSEARAFEGRRRDKANNGLTVLAMLMTFYLAANRRGYRELAQLRVNAEQLRREATQAQFVALRNQVNPHFLFNSLSILASLVEVDPRLSVRFINQLARVYRYILEQRDTERVSLQTELEFLEAYRFLLDIRFEGKLRVTTDLAALDPARYAIAPLTLQLLLENAVKHNQMSDRQPLRVTIAAEADYLVVRNPLQRRSTTDPAADPSTGLGLENIRTRYALLTRRPLSASEEGAEFVVRIPLLPWQPPAR